MSDAYKRRPLGTRDFLPGEVEKWQYMERTARELCAVFNYREIRTPIFEHTELFERGVGDTTDIVEKEMYTFTGKGDNSLTLRPEGTAGVVRAYVENKLYGEPDLTKLYYIGPMFRYERPQAGRYRQFHQFGVEAIGSEHPSLDAEIIALGYTFCKKAGLTDFRVEINSVGTPEDRTAYRQRLQQFFAPVKDKLCKDCQSRFDRNPMRILDCKIDVAYCKGAPVLMDDLQESSKAYFEAVQSYLTAMDIPYTLNLNLVRGLDYYTHTAFEYKADGIGAIDTVGGGGRYNGLVGQIGGSGNDQPGVGFGIGLERIALVLQSQGFEIPNGPQMDVYLVGLGEAAEKEVTRILHTLRVNGISAEKDYTGRKMKAQMKSADRFQARYAAILGDDELARGEISLKAMLTGEQETVKLDALVEKLQSTRGKIL